MRWVQTIPFLLGGGRYPGFVVRNKHGRSDAYITIKSYSGERAIIDPYLGLAEPPHHTVAIYPSSYLVFENLEVSSSDPWIDEVRRLDVGVSEDLETFQKQYKSDARINQGGIRVHYNFSTGARSHHLVFREMEVHRLFNAGFAGSGDDIQFINNHVYDMGYPRSGYGWYFGGARQIYRGNVVHDNWAIAFNCFGSTGGLTDSIVEGNLIYRHGGLSVVSLNPPPGNVKSNGIGININPSKNTIVRNNIVYDITKVFAFMAMRVCTTTRYMAIKATGFMTA
ncbi:MAG: right-handed parallel beta-helix repeat-containing protein [Myxococcota bacterium]